MRSESAVDGSLFSFDFLSHGICQTPEWSGLDGLELARVESDIIKAFSSLPIHGRPNEAQTESDLIWPVLETLDWTDALRQQNLSSKGREDVPDGLLFPSAEAKSKANDLEEEWRRYRFGIAVVESKRWGRPLDRRSERRGEEVAPSTQMMRYMRRVDDVTNGGLRWGILTNGSRWRLYFSGARSVSEQFLEIDLASTVGAEGPAGRSVSLVEEERRHWLRVFILMFRREAFQSSGADGRSFHGRALDEGRFYEERVAEDLSTEVFGNVFPELARAIAVSVPDADLPEVREGALILLYRLLFILYAEDRDLLPASDSRYGEYGLRNRVRLDRGTRLDRGDVFSTSAARYWSALSDLFLAINEGDASIGLPPYNGGLFDEDRTPILTRVRIPDNVMAGVIGALSFETTGGDRKYINYRNLSVQQLGSIYERLLEYDVVREDDRVEVRPNLFARKGSGSYYTPGELVHLILTETLEPLAAKVRKAFQDRISELWSEDLADYDRMDILRDIDPASALIEFRICDPAMGSGHFLVSVVDYMTDQVIGAMADAEQEVPKEWGDYVSPLIERIDTIRRRIRTNARTQEWMIDEDQLDDRHVVRRMVLKRCVYGVDKNPMAVELAKVSLWLHTFTVGAPLSFLDHHLRCGDSLFGLWVKTGIDRAAEYGKPLLLHEPMQRALQAASKMQVVEGLTDAEIAEAHLSADIFSEVREMTAPLDGILKLIHALDWLGIKGKRQRTAVHAFFDGKFGDPFDIAVGKRDLIRPEPKSRGERMRGTVSDVEVFDTFSEVYEQASRLIGEERFMNWQVTFPGVWFAWEEDGLAGGFDAIVGNPPWDRMKLQQVEWFAARRRAIAMTLTAADRQKMIKELKDSGDPLASDYRTASERVSTAGRIARSSGEYPLLSKGDLNLYSLFVERSMTIVKRDGLAGLLVPSGIASDKTASEFFRGVATGGRLKALYDFENRRNRYSMEPFFGDVHRSFKFSVFVAGPSMITESANCAFFLQDVSELEDDGIRISFTADDFARVNPNTGTAPVFRARRDAELTMAIYGRSPILVDRSSGEESRVWPLRYRRMFDMTNDSGLFRRRGDLEEKEGAWPLAGNILGSPSGNWLPLYEGKMVQAYDHRAASVMIDDALQYRPRQPKAAELAQYQNPRWSPNPRFWVKAADCGWANSDGWVLAFKEITAPTNVRTMIASLVPLVGFGNKLPLLMPEGAARNEWLLLANLNSIPFDFVCRQKVHGQTLNLFIVEQLPVIVPARFEAQRFGTKSAAEIVRQAVLELTYTAHDMAPFAHDMGHVDGAGKVLPPFVWNEERRLVLRAKLDAVFFHLYGITDRDDIRHIYSSFPIMERREKAAFGGEYRSRQFCLAYVNALSAGRPDAEVSI